MNFKNYVIKKYLFEPKIDLRIFFEGGNGFLWWRAEDGFSFENGQKRLKKPRRLFLGAKPRFF